MRRLALLALAFCAVAVAPANGDRLVTTDGTVIETDGGWEQRGRVIVFTRQGGGLESIRADDVDLEATARLGRESTAPAEPPDAAEATEAPKARLVLTDADVARAPSPPAPAEGEAEAEGEAATSSEAASEGGETSTSTGVRVIAWDDEEPADGEGRRIFGTLRNDGNTFAADVSVEVSVFDSDGALVGTQSATPVKTSLRPGESTTFSLQFRDAYSLGAVRTRVSSLELDVGQATATPLDDAAGGL